MRAGGSCARCGGLLQRTELWDFFDRCLLWRCLACGRQTDWRIDAHRARRVSPARMVDPVKNKLTDLNDHLFAQLERLSDEALTAEQIIHEINRTDAIVKVSEQIIDNAALALRGAELVAEHSGKGTFEHLLPMIGRTTMTCDGTT